MFVTNVVSSFFVSQWNRAISWPSVLHDPSTKRFSSIFDSGPPNAQNLLPKICTKSPISRLVWQINRRCLGLLGGFWGRPIQWNHAKCCGADPCCHGNEIWARRGDPVAYRLVYMYVYHHCFIVRLQLFWFCYEKTATELISFCCLTAALKVIMLLNSDITTKSQHGHNDKLIQPSSKLRHSECSQCTYSVN